MSTVSVELTMSALSEAILISPAFIFARRVQLILEPVRVGHCGDKSLASFVTVHEQVTLEIRSREYDSTLKGR
jgi:hypothetical protein